MNMKLKKFFMGLLGAAALTACSSDIPLDNPADNPGLGEGENYISVAIQMPAGVGSRATAGDFDDGTAAESEVKNIVFFFFDADGNCIDVQKEDNPEFKKPTTPSTNPNITSYGNIEVRLKAGLNYINGKLGVALNSPADDATELKAEIKTLSDFLSRTKSYTARANNDNLQVMSNSVYFDMSTSDVKPTDDKKVDVISITDKNIYSSAEKNDIEHRYEIGEKERVEIYVERVLAKIVVSKPEFDMTKYYTYKDGDETKTTITTYDHVTGSSAEITVKPVVKGMALNVLSPKAALIKPIKINELGYGIGSATLAYKDFQWNDPRNKRSYWATTAFSTETDMGYKKWSEVKDKGLTGLTEYIHPNTQAYEPILGNEGSSLNTKVMVTAELHKFENGDDKGAIDLVMFGSDYMLADNFLKYVASVINRDIRAIDWSTAIQDVTLTDDERDKIATAVQNAFNAEQNKGYKADNLDMVLGPVLDGKKFGGEDWTVIVKVKEGISTPEIPGLPNVAALETGSISVKVNEQINKVVGSSLGKINENRVMYWKDGKTYYYTNIRHQGFDGLVGGGTSNFLYGVVRNHVYNVNLTGIYGLGTPVIDPDRPINPDRPNDERPSYIQAKINILPWRVVTNNATIH